jgi:outer membrane immunogenic protein
LQFRNRYPENEPEARSSVIDNFQMCQSALLSKSIELGNRHFLLGEHYAPFLGRSLASLISIGFAGLGAASAADMPVKGPVYKAAPMPIAIYNWTGFYVGVNGGYGWENSTGNLVANSGGIAIPTAIAGGTIPRNLGIRPSGGLGGAQAGYNWQVDHVVFGIEGDIQGAGIKQSVAIAAAGTPGVLLPTLSTGSSALYWFGTVRGRLGYAWNTFMLYGTGGLAYGGVSDSAGSQTVPPPPLGTGFSSSTRTGWAAGAGFEWAFKPSWSVKGEYLHIDLGSSTATVLFPTSPTDFLTYSFTHRYDIARIGINYKFTAGPVVAKY